MNKHKWLAFTIVAILVTALVLPASPVLGADPNGNGQLKYKGGKITPAERKAAGALFQEQFQAALAEGAATTAAVADPGGVPHYFGPYPNWANSPMPTGAVVSVMVDAGGNSYTAPAVTITDLYDTVGAGGAVATAAVDPVTGAITGITVTDGGTGYTRPVVTISDPTGTGAMATATIGGVLSGGIHKFVDSLPGLGVPGQALPPEANNLNQYIPLAIPDQVSWPAGGAGYTSAPNIIIEDSTGTGAAATATVAGGVVTGVTIDNPGSGYSANPTIIFSGGGATSQAVAIPTVDPATGTITAITPAGADYYEIAVVEWSEKMHTDLPPTRVRGYVQLETPEVLAAMAAQGLVSAHYDVGGGHFAIDEPHYMGPTIVSRRNVPVRVKFYNLLPYGPPDPVTGVRPGDLFIPVDTTAMGAGTGPLGGTETYTQNRAVTHLHGNNSVWISDGTPNQWITPAGETTSYPEGVSVRDVPDMITAGPNDGVTTLYYTNALSARLQFYHDHALAITRLNVYVGEAAPYLITDQVEEDIINGTNVSGVNPTGAQVLPDIGIPLVIQDKSFVDANTIAYQDPTWAWGTGKDTAGNYLGPVTGDLWYPHVYMPAQDPWTPDGLNPFGRWHYAAWFWPPATNLMHNPVPNPYYQPDPNLPNYAPWEPPLMPDFPNPSMVGEAFMDTPMVNGTVYPYAEVEPRAYRFRILSIANDRSFNLSWFVANPDDYAVTDASGNSFGTEVRMLPATPTPGWPELWPADGRAGGVPDPASAGPDWIQIGSEGGFLPAPAVIPAQPTTYVLDPTLFNVGNVLDHSLLLGPAERADVIVDFSQFAGQTLILYNDAPAAFPALDPHYDYYTGDPDNTDIGGAPTTQPGYGPNTRTIMQIRVAGTPTLQVGSVNLATGGSGYTQPQVDIVGGNPGVAATATATGIVDHITVNNLGIGYTAPTVTVATPIDPLGTQATAIATVVDGSITRITVNNPGSGYTTAPAVNIVDAGGGIGATAQATLSIAGLTLTSPGSAYSSVPVVVIHDAIGTGIGATALATLVDIAAPPAYDVATLESVFAKTAAKRGVFEVSQDPIIFPQAEYGSAYNNTNYPSDPAVAYIQQHDFSKTFQPIDANGTLLTLPDGTPNLVNIRLQPKAIQDEMGEAYDTEYGRMSGMLALELPVTVAGVQQFMLYPFMSPPVEIIRGSLHGTQIGEMGDGTQIWKITHNGVDTHVIHTHLFNVQIVNRVAWDGMLIPPDANELGWKESFRVNPLEHTIVALRPFLPNAPWQVPNSVRLIDPTKPEGAMLMTPPGGFKDPAGNPIVDPNGMIGVIYNHFVNYGFEYMEHCHLLAHEEMDMMHAFAITGAPMAPSNVAVTLQGNKATITWMDNSLNETSFTIQRSFDNFATVEFTYAIGANTNTFADPNQLKNKTTYYYRVFASNTVGDTTLANFPTMTADSAYSSPTVIVTK